MIIIGSKNKVIVVFLRWHFCYMKIKSLLHWKSYKNNDIFIFFT